MKYQPLTVTEYHSSHITQPKQAIRQVITVWLTKELHK